MRADKTRRAGKYPLLLLALMAVSLFAASCRNNEVEVPPLTGPSGARLFITMEASPDHLVIHAPGRPRETSLVTLQLKNDRGIGVAGQNVKLRIANVNGAELNIGRLSDYNVTTDSAGFARVIYTAPDSAEQPIGISVYVLSIMTDPAYPFEVTDKHELNLESSAVAPGECIFGGAGSPEVSFTSSPNPVAVHHQVCFTPSISESVIKVLWDFGDGTRTNELSPCHTYDAVGTFNVSLVVEDADHNCGSSSGFVTVNQGAPATCTIVFSPTAVNIGDTVNFTALTSDPDGRVRRFLWNFGDGKSTSTSRNTTTHKYTFAGSFNVVLTITDDEGNVSFCQATVTVQSNPPVCSAVANPTTGGNPLLVNFDGSGSSDDTGIASFTWDFGDGATGSGPTTSHNYAATCTAPCVQNFTFALTVTDDEGNTSSCGGTITVNNP